MCFVLYKNVGVQAGHILEWYIKTKSIPNLLKEVDRGILPREIFASFSRRKKELSTYQFEEAEVLLVRRTSASSF